jgi:DNA-binding winged helix-turn-helix (wHTH) protein
MLALTDGWVDRARGRVHRADAVTDLTPRELGLLVYLADHAPRVVEAGELLVEVWGYRPGVDSRTVVSTLHTLRRKVERDPRRPDHLLTVRGEGYRFVPPEAPTWERASAADPAVRRRLDLARAEHLALDHPERALALVGDEDDPLRVELLIATGRLAEAERLVAPLTGRGALAAGDLARRRGEFRTALAWYAEAARRGPAEVAAEGEKRAAVVRLDEGEPAFDGLARARALLGEGAERVRAGIWLEEGLYRLLVPVADLDLAERAFAAGLADAETAESAFLLRAAHLGAAVVHRARRATAAADRALAATDACVTERWEEPGIYVFRAIERHLDGDADGARRQLDAGAARDAERPNPGDRAHIERARAALDGRRGPRTPPLLTP